MNLLHVDSSILGPASVSRGLSANIVDAWKAKNPSSKVIYRDLAVDPISHLNGPLLLAAAIDASQHTPEISRELAVSAKVMAEFLAGLDRSAGGGRKDLHLHAAGTERSRGRQDRHRRVVPRRVLRCRHASGGGRSSGELPEVHFRLPRYHRHPLRSRGRRQYLAGKEAAGHRCCRARRAQSRSLTAQAAGRGACGRHCRWIIDLG
jgi:hypothetical protein